MSTPTPPIDLRRPAGQDQAVSDAVRDAMKAALRGDWSAADKLELDCLNLFVRIGELVARHADGEPHWWFTKGGAVEQYGKAPFVVDILRGFTRDGRTALEWRLLEKCRRCDGKLRRLPCRVCAGRWYVEDMHDHETFYTDVDGVILEERS